MPENRGFHFLAGLATLWLLWRLYAAGIILQTIAYATGQDVCINGEIVAASGPGAIVVAFVIEGVITIGWVVTLLASGLWDAILAVGRLIADAFGQGHLYLKDAQKPVDALAPSTVADERQLTPEQAAIELLSKQMQEIAAKLPPAAKAAKVTK